MLYDDIKLFVRLTEGRDSPYCTRIKSHGKKDPDGTCGVVLEQPLGGYFNWNSGDLEFADRTDIARLNKFVRPKL